MTPTPDIDSLADRFASYLNRELQHWTQDQAKKASPNGEVPSKMKVRVNLQPDTRVRTPEEQALQIIAKRSWTCQSSHMSDRARHVPLIKNSKYVGKPKDMLTHEEYVFFAATWTSALKKFGLRNYRGGDRFHPGDPYHVELKNSKLPFDDPRVQACLERYAELTRKSGGPKNTAFEDSPKLKHIKDWLNVWEKNNKVRDKK